MRPIFARDQSRRLVDRLLRSVAGAPQAHMKNQAKFDLVSLRAPKDDPEVGGDYYGLPWPCWGKPKIRHPGSPILYRTDVHVKDGGGTFRARFGIERTGKTLLAENSYTKGSELIDGYPEFTMAVLQKLGWDKDLTPEELAIIKKIGGEKVGTVSWSIDLSGGIQRVCLEHGVMHYGNGKARAVAWNLPDPVPVHREPIYSPRPELVAKYPTRPDERQFRIMNAGFTVQQNAVKNEISKKFPLILSSGRLVEYEGGGEETRSNRWLAELQQDMFVEINPADAAERGISDGQWVWVLGAEGDARARVKALVTERVGKGVTWMPFHFSGWFMGEDRRKFYPAGMDPIVLGESVNTLTTYGFDPVTGMQEAKVTFAKSGQRDEEEQHMARMKFLCDADRCIECNACVTACKNEHDVPWGINRRRVVTINDGKPGERSVSMACMHCTDAPCAAVCPVDCFYTTADAVVLHSKDLCIGCGYCFYACPFGAPQYPRVGNFGSRGKMDKCTFCAGGPEPDDTAVEYVKYGANRLAQGKLPLCAEMCSTKSLLAGDGEIIATIYKERVKQRGYGSGAWGWQTAYRETITG